MVSPTGAPLIFLMPATKYPTSPADKESFLIFFGEKMPISSTLWVWPVECILNFCPVLIVPFLILINETTPRYESNHESTINACNGLVGLPLGDGMPITRLSSNSSMPTPVLALTKGAEVAFIPIISSISFFTLSGSDWGKSILFITGTTSRSWSTAV